MNKINTIVYGITLLSSIGMLVTILQLPTPTPIPGIVFLVLGVVALFGVKANKAVSGIALAIISSWALLAYSAPHIKNYAEQLAGNPYVSYDTQVIIYGIAGILVFGCILVCVLIRQAQYNLDEVDPLGDLEEDNRNLFIKLYEAYKTRKFTNQFAWMDLEICTDTKTGQPVVLKGIDRYLSQLITGSTGTGKTSRVIKPWIYQDLLRIKAGHKMAITVIEPSGDLAEDVAEMCREMNIPCVHIDPFNEDSDKFNIMQGNAEAVAETTRTVLKEIFGKQDAFFSQVQQTAARNTILLLKRLQGDDIDLTDVVRALRDLDRMQSLVTLLKEKEGNTDLVQYFDNELLGSMRDKYHQFAAGLRQQLEDIVGNEQIRRVIIGNSSIDLDKHLAEGGVFVVNTGLELGEVGDTFGKFVIGQVKAAVFRRPGSEWTRIPHHWVIDEFPVYVNEDFRRVLAIGRKYRNTTTLAVQTIDDVVLKGGEVLAKIFMQNCRNKIVFGGMSENDAVRWEKEFGKKETILKQPTYDNRILVPPIFAKSYRLTKNEEARVPYTKLMELKEFQFIYRIVKDGRLQPPGQGKGRLVNNKSLSQKAKSLPLKQKLASLKESYTDILIEKTIASLKESYTDILIKKTIETKKDTVSKISQLKNDYSKQKIKENLKKINIQITKGGPHKETIKIENIETKPRAEQPQKTNKAKNKIVFLAPKKQPVESQEAEEPKEQPKPQKTNLANSKPTAKTEERKIEFKIPVVPLNTKEQDNKPQVVKTSSEALRYNARKEDKSKTQVEKEPAKEIPNQNNRKHPPTIISKKELEEELEVKDFWGA